MGGFGRGRKGQKNAIILRLLSADVSGRRRRDRSHDQPVTPAEGESPSCVQAGKAPSSLLIVSAPHFLISVASFIHRLYLWVSDVIIVSPVSRVGHTGSKGKGKTRELKMG